jgi:hypothetical protein
MDGFGKKCSVVFMDADASSKVNSYLRFLPVEQLPADYELLFIGALQLQNELECSESAQTNIKFIQLEYGLGFEQLCIEAAKQASGEYILFINIPISCKRIVAAVRRLEINGMSIEAPPEEKYIIVKADAFIQAHGFGGLSQQQKKQMNDRFINKLIHLVTESAAYTVDVLFAASRNRLLLEEGIKCIDFTKTDKRNFYKLLFIKSIKGYLDSGIEINDPQQYADFYHKVELKELTEVPWFVGILLSILHLSDEPGLPQPDMMVWRQSAAILVSLYNETRFSELCFKAVRKYTNFPYHLVAINNSTLDMQDFKKSILEQNLVDEWFDSGCTSHAGGLQNALDRVKTFRYIVTLDNDSIVLKEGWLTELVTRLKHENAGLIGPQTFPKSNPSVKGYAVHPCCMVIDRQRIGSKFEINFTGHWPFDVGHLVTWECLAHGIPIVKVSHEVNKTYTTGSSLVNKSVRHFWYCSRMFGFKDEDFFEGHKVSDIRKKLDLAYHSDELRKIREFHMPPKSLI